MSNLLLIQALIVVTSALVYHAWFGRRAKLNLSPGPKPLPILGNVRDLPPKGVPEYHQHWLKHKDTYGPISSLTILGKVFILIHDRQAAHDILEKEATKTSGRPESVFASRLCGYEKFLVFRQCNRTLRWQRRLLQKQIGTRSCVDRYHKLIETEVQHFLVRALREPENLQQLCKT